ncbi:DUF982 domain-containing protein [Mesorhizobium sangaii]|uniref:DUF982 domain-containing protein n=1 Tax=Mesorhizobium sangaii TaxID=505389 RepID=UPI003CCDCD5D
MVASSWEALECLHDQWPEWARGPSRRAACCTCCESWTVGRLRNAEPGIKGRNLYFSNGNECRKLRQKRHRNAYHRTTEMGRELAAHSSDMFEISLFGRWL